MKTAEEAKRPRLRAAAVIRRGDGKILLALHRKNGREAWLFPGGGVDWCEPTRGALARELQEELGLEIQVGALKLVSETIDPAGSRHLVSLYFESRLAGGEITLGGDERVVGAEWFAADQIKPLRMHPALTEEQIRVLLSECSEDRFVESPWV